VIVTVKYVFGLARSSDGRDTLSLELPPGATVFEALRRLGVSALELHAAVNGESAADGTVLRDGDEMILIPSIQGGRGGRRGVAMRRSAVVASVLVSLGLAGPAVERASAQTRVVVPIVIQAPRATPSRASAPSSVHVTTRTGSSQPGVSTTHISVRDTSGASRSLSAQPSVRTLATTPSGATSLQVTTRTESRGPGVTATRVTVHDTTGAGRTLGVPTPAGSLATAPHGASSILVTVDRSLGPAGTGVPGLTRVTTGDVSGAGRVTVGALPVSSLRTAGPGQQTVTITSEAPIETPIVILSQ
jgi:molybdopterin converting factor small subunit